MKNNNIKFLVLFAGICLKANLGAYAQDSYTPDQLRSDFMLFRQALQEAHPGLYRYNSRARMDSLFRQTETQLNHEMTQQEFYQLLLPVVSQVKCGHTKLHPDNNWTDNYFYGQDKVFPYKLFFRGKKAYITGSYDEKMPEAKGLEVTSMNGIPMTEIIDKLLSAFFSDGSNTTFKYIEMSKYFSAYYANFFEAPDSFSIICQKGTDKTFIKVPAISRTIIDAYEKQQAALKSGKAPYSLEFTSDKVALLTVSSFWLESKEKRYKKFLKESFAEIHDRGIQNLIIDVRDNEGGQDARGAWLLSYLMDKKFRYYDRLEATTPKKYTFAKEARLPRFYGIMRMMISGTDSGTFVWKHSRNLKVQKPQRKSYAGKVYVLINGASFSVTAEFASVAHYLKRATFIGEETGGGYYGNNSGAFVIVTLPNSRLNIGIPMLAYYTAVKDYPYHDHGVIPDYEVKPDIQDILNDKDVALEFTKQLITASGE
ncbi:MAG: hypothetical protein JW830_13605 [Bacteroidales bacterium]|nr:hypothetical protein [Bacteroidales bacterium]